MSAIPLLFLLLSPLSAQEPPPESSSARLEQEVLPELARRREVAARQKQARRSFFAGEGALSAAFPRLTGAMLESPAALRGRLVMLDAETAKRAAERVAAPPQGDPALLDALGEARAAALDAEDEAASLERRALVALLAQLETAPGMTLAGLSGIRGPLQARIAAAEGRDATDEAGARALQDAAEAAAALQELEALLATLRRVVLVPGAVLPRPDADLAALKEPSTALLAAARLELMLGVLPESASVEAGLGAWLDGRIAQASAALEAAQQSTGLTAVLPEEAPTTLAERRARIAILEAEAARLKNAAEAARSTDDSAERAQEQAETSRREAEVASATARSATERRTAQILRASADAQERTSALWAEARSAEEANNSQRSEIGTVLAESAEQVAVLQSKSSLLLNRAEADSLYTALRSTRTDLRTAIRTHEDALFQLRLSGQEAEKHRAAEQQQLKEAQGALDTITDPELKARLATALNTWSESISGEQEAGEALLATTRIARDSAVRALDETRLLRKALEPMISATTRQQERGLTLLDLQQELSMLQPRLRVQLSDQLLSLRQLPSRLLDLNALRSMFLGSFWVLVLLGGWWAARARADGSVDRALSWMAQRRVLLNRGDLEPARLPMFHALQTLLDLVVGWLLLETIAGLSVVLGMAVQIYLAVALFRFLMALYDLLFAQHPAVRPALRVLRPEVFARLRRSLRLVLIWTIGQRIIHLFLEEALGLYTLSGLVGTLLRLAGLALVLWLLNGWEPTLRAVISRRKGSSLVTYLSQPPRSPVLTVPNALVGLVFLVVTTLSDVIPSLAREGSRFGTVLARFSRYRLARSEVEEGDPDPLPAAVLDALRQAESPGSSLDRQAVVDTLLAGYRRWHETRRRGVVGVIGGPGDGREDFQSTLTSALRDDGLSVITLQITDRLRTEADVVRWLSASLSLPEAPDSLDALVEVISAGSDDVLLLDGLHRAFLRAVGGFEAIQALLYVLGATAESRFWVVLLHRPAWRYLSALKDLLNTGVFQSLVELPPARESQLRAITTARAEAVGLTQDFHRFIQSSPLGADPDVEQEQAIRVFYRLLTEASGGRVAVAMRMWQSCLTPIADGQVEVWAHPCLSQTDLPDLKASDLLTLTLLLIQDTLTEAELVELLEISSGRLRASLKELQTRGLLQRDGDHIIITPIQIPVVTQALRRRNFVQWS